MRRTTVRVALLVLVGVIALAAAELTSDGFRSFVQDHPLIATFLTEAVLLVGVYLVIDEIIQRRETRRWSDVTSLGKRALSARADESAKVVRAAVSEFALATSGDGGRAQVSDSAQYPQLVANSGDELEIWLRDNAERARSFADSMRRSATRLEDSIVRWGPTLVEDPDCAALINLLPDIVDAARSAAESVAPTPGAVGRDDGQSFADDLLVVLRNAGTFSERVS